MPENMPPIPPKQPVMAADSDELLIQIDRQGKILRVNQAALDCLGIEEGSCRGSRIIEWVHQDDRALTREIFDSWFSRKMPSGRLRNRLVGKDGKARHISWNVSSQLNAEGGIESLTCFGQQTGERRRAEQSLRYESAVNMAMAEIASYLLGGCTSFEDIAHMVREKAMELTGSRHAFVSVIDTASKFDVGHSLSMLSDDCTLLEKDACFPPLDNGEYPGLWGHSLNTGEILISENPGSHPAAKGLPKGHVPIKRFMCVPVKNGSRVLGQIALANSTRPYNQFDSEMLTRMANLYSLAIVKKHQNTELLNRQERLEQLLLERTADLVEAGQAYEAESKARRVAVEALLESHKLVEKTFASLSDTVLVIDARNLMIVTSNPAAEQVMEYSQEELSGLDLERLFKDQDTYKAFMRSLLPGLNERAVFSKECVLLTGRGRRLAAQITVTYLLDDIGSPNAMVWAVKDISNRRLAEEKQRRLEAQLRQAQKMEALGTLAGGIAHDFNNILGAIVGFGELAKDAVESGLKPVHELNQVLKAAERARFLVSQILNFSRTSYHDKLPLDLNSTIKEALKLLRATIPSTIEFRTSIPAKEIITLADGTQVHQVILNLCTNAFHAMEDLGGVLSVSLKEVDFHEGDPGLPLELNPGRYAELTVSDTGCGMEPAILSRIFDPFFTTKKKNKGTGLGLSVVHGIMHNHKGAISVKSKRGEGSEFSVYWPLAERNYGHAGESPHQKSIPGGNEHLLIVDDEDALVEIVRRMLAGMGYRVTATSQPQKALEIFEADPDSFDLLITDHTMPLITGAELAEHMMNIKPGLPVILCTGYSHSMNPDRAKAMGIKRYLTKPLMAEELGLAIREVLDSKS